VAAGLIAAAALLAPASAAAQAPVKAALKATQSGGKVTFDASHSTGAADYQWDLNRDGTFEVDSGTTPTTSAGFPPGATVIATVKVTGADGTSDQATTDITLEQAPKPQTQSVAGAEPAPAPAAKPKVVAAAAGGVTIKDFSFGPKTLTINTGDSVTWTNQGPTGHSTTAKGGGWDSGVLSAGKSFSHTFTQAGTYQYFCTPHPFMTATIVVKAASSSSGGNGSSGSGSTGSASGSGAGTNGTGTTATPAATATNPNDLPNTGGDPFPWVALGGALLVFGAALRWRLRTQ
jgi:LPXTG-motif cell wall-anchored protein